MPRKFKGRLNHREIIKLLTTNRGDKSKPYLVDGGHIYRQVKTRWVRMAYRDRNGYDAIYLYHEGKRRLIGVHSIVWMAHTKFPIPHKFQIHHRNRKKRPNTFDNLMCVHQLDHDKFHEEHPDTPF